MPSSEVITLGDKGIIVVAIHGEDDDNDLGQMLREKPNAHTLEVHLREPGARSAVAGLTKFAEENDLSFRVVDEIE